MLHALFDINILIYFLLVGVFLLVGKWVSQQSGFFREMIDAKLADPGYEGHLEGLRGVLAFSVFIHHAAYTWQSLNHGDWYGRPPDSHFLILIGGASVSMFFFLTGYLFWSGFLNRGTEEFSVYRFYEKRLLRIVPAYWLFCVVMLVIVMLDAGGVFRTSWLAWTVGTAQWLMFGVPLGSFPDINEFSQTRLINAGIAWSLRHEFLYYLLLPFLLPFVRKMGTVWLLLVFAATFVSFKLLNSLAFQAPTDGVQYGAWPHMFLNAGLIEFNKFLLIGFAPGMLTAFVLYRPEYRRLVDAIQRHHAVWMAAACLFVLLINTEPELSFLKVLPLSVIFFLIAAKMIGFNMLRSRGLMFMGVISYSVYIFHGVFLFLLEPHGLNIFSAIGQPGIGAYWVLIAGVGLVTLMTSALVYRYVEFPCLSFGKRAATQPKPLSPH